MRTLTHVVRPEEEGRPVRTLVPRIFQLGTHAFRRLKVNQGILVNGEPVHASFLLHAGDQITLCLETQETASESSPLIRYLDEDMIIVCKPAPLATLPGRDHGVTLRELLADALHQEPGSFVFHPVNRLDKGTSGLLVVARHAHAQRLLSTQLHSNTFLREYLAITEGIPEPESAVISAPISKAGTGARRMVDPDGKPAITHYTVLEAHHHRALVRLRLETGRTHQIRVHLASIGCPLVGDYLYGTPLASLQDRFALHSARLCCMQPITGKTLEITEPLPPELASLL